MAAASTFDCKLNVQANQDFIDLFVQEMLTSVVIDSAGNMEAQRALTPTDSPDTFYKRVTIISHNRLKNGDYVKLKSLNTDCSVYFAKLKGVNNEAR